MDTNYSPEIIYKFTYESIDSIEPPISRETINYILANIQFNYLLIIFTLGCFTSLLFCHKKPISRKKFIILPSYQPTKNFETDPILAKV